jgi:hypothetical protein
MSLRPSYNAVVQAQHTHEMHVAMKNLKFVRDTFGEEAALDALNLASKEGLVRSEFDYNLLKQYITDSQYHQAHD